MYTNFSIKPHFRTRFDFSIKLILVSKLILGSDLTRQIVKVYGLHHTDHVSTTVPTAVPKKKDKIINLNVISGEKDESHCYMQPRPKRCRSAGCAEAISSKPSSSASYSNSLYFITYLVTLLNTILRYLVKH